ncbi:MAG: energy transducer TonB [Bacteriovoracaceae bacterium]
MKVFFLREEVFILSVMAPLGLSLALLLATVKAPHELFTIEHKKNKSRSIQKVEVKANVKEEVPKNIPISSLSQSLAAPAPSLGGDLNTLTAGLVSEGNGGSGGMNITQGTQVKELVQNSEGQSRPARAVRVVDPAYPRSAQARGIEGHVIIEVQISERGEVTEAHIISAEPQGIFDQVAIEAIKKWSFEPGIENGKTIVSKIKQKVNFELN